MSRKLNRDFTKNKNMFLIGFVAALLGSLSSGAGQTVQKYALLKLEEESSANKLPLISPGHSKGSKKPRVLSTTQFYQRLKSGYWWTGIGLHYFGEIGNALAMSQISASIVAPMGILAVLTNVFLANR